MSCSLYSYVLWVAEEGCCLVGCGDICPEGEYGLVGVLEVVVEELVLVGLECSVVVDDEWFKAGGVGLCVPACEGGSDEAVVWVVVGYEYYVFDCFSF